MSLPNSIRPLKCKFPPCPCERCKESRACREQQAKKPQTNPSSCKCATNGDADACRCDPCDSGNGCCNTSNNFIYFITEAVGLATFLITMAVLFWLTVGHYAIILGVKFYKAHRSVQLLILAIVGFLILSILGAHAGHAIRNYRARRAAAPKPSPPPLPPKPTPPEEKQEEPSCTEKNITITITDEKAREIFKQSKLYAIPSEMKQPPAILVYLRDVILRNV